MRTQYNQTFENFAFLIRPFRRTKKSQSGIDYLWLLKNNFPFISSRMTITPKNYRDEFSKTHSLLQTSVRFIEWWFFTLLRLFPKPRIQQVTPSFANLFNRSLTSPLHVSVVFSKRSLRPGPSSNDTFRNYFRFLLFSKLHTNQMTCFWLNRLAVFLDKSKNIQILALHQSCSIPRNLQFVVLFTTTTNF